jgi:protein TonB
MATDLEIQQRIAAEDSLYAHLLEHREEGMAKWVAGILAFVIHVVILFFAVFPSMSSPIEQVKKEAIVVKKYIPPPPEIQPREIVKQKFTRKVAVPDPTPDEPEPIREPEPEIEPVPIPPDATILIGVPEAPPPSGPLVPGAGGVTNPVLLEETKVKPEYPELARVARLEGKVILQAIIHKDGSVGDVSVLQSTRPNLGFEDAAMAAVKQWKYQPAMQGNRPVDVYFTIVVDFELH